MKLLALLAVIGCGYLLAMRVFPWLAVRLLRLVGFRMRTTPLTEKRIRRFRSIGRGYWSFVIICTVFVSSLFLEVLVNDKPIYIRFAERTAYPALRDLGNTWLFFLDRPFKTFDRSADFGLTGEGQLDFRTFDRCFNDPETAFAAVVAGKEGELEKLLSEIADTSAEIEELKADGEEPEEWLTEDLEASRGELTVIEEEIRQLRSTRESFLRGEASIFWPLYRQGPYNTRLYLPGSVPHSPTLGGIFGGGDDSGDGEGAMNPFEAPLGTDSAGVDVLPQLFYGFRVSVGFSLLVLTIGYAMGILVGGLMGYYGGWTDILLQRLIEIWGSIPFLFTIMIIASVINPSFWMLAVLLILLRSWLAITYYIRGEFYREKARDYVQAAIGCGVGDFKVMAKHILPNSMIPVVSRAPFSFVSYISALVSLDFLGFGLPPTEPSWGRLLNQGFEFIKTDPHLVVMPVMALAVTLFLVVMIGEAVREAFDPKVFSRLR
ncbi:MAG TPA: ABC transporter permease subunit [Planctomycetes bacterium]|nr:ABC transporter permease subunit [Planctomycetota bacterium]HIN80940.1 ABC transporter permease subunit [Planctomycetota bacterium]